MRDKGTEGKETDRREICMRGAAASRCCCFCVVDLIILEIWWDVTCIRIYC